MSEVKQCREGYDYWDKLCAIPRYGFIHSSDNSRVLKAEGIGNWIDRDEAMKVMDDAQEERDTLHTANLRLEGALRTLHGLMHHKAATPLELEAIRMSEAALRGNGGE